MMCNMFKALLDMYHNSH